MTLKIPEWLTGDARDSYATSLKAAETGNYEPVLSIASYGYGFDETASGGVIAGGCGHLSYSSDCTSGNLRTLTICCDADGVHERDSSSFDTTSSTLTLGGDGSSEQYESFIHFESLNVPANATIVDAYLTLNRVESSVSYGSVDVADFEIACEDVDDATIPSDSTAASSAVRTSAKITTGGWWTHWDTFDSIRTPNLKDVVQEVIDRAGWSSGNAINFWMDKPSSPNWNDATVEIDSIRGCASTSLTVVYTTSNVTEITVDCTEDGIWNNLGFVDGDASYGIGDWNSGEPIKAFLRFDNVLIPAEKTIAGAYLELTNTFDDRDGYGKFPIYLCDEDDSSTITGNTDGDSRALTTVFETSIPHFAHLELDKKSEINLAAVVQEVVDRAGWSSGNALQFILKPEDTNSLNGTIWGVGASIAARRPVLRILYVDPPIEGEGGIVAGGHAALSGSTTAMTSGGILAGGISAISKRTSAMSAGGVVLGSTAISTTIISEEAAGGVVLAGEARVPVLYEEIATGGLVVSQPMFENGFTHRTSVTVPARSVGSDMVFYLGVRLDIHSNEFLITDLDGHVQSHEVRDVTETDTCLFWRCQLESGNDNVFLVYFNMEDS